MSEKILVAMSGGVDSAVVAYLVKQAGYDTISATMRIGCLYNDTYTNSCCSDSEIADAKKMAKHLGIDHYVVDLTNDFKKTVSDHFIATYLNGATPNPCVECNKHIKFGKLLNFALSQGATKIATGHYASTIKQSDRYLLQRSTDITKDQTYMLWQLTQQQLSRAWFPLAEYKKEEVKAISAELGLIATHKKESQDICFIPNGKYAEFIQNAIEKNIKKGSFIDTNGNILGDHRGIIYYTPGQRKGLGMTFGQPMYVKSKCAENNTVTLCRESELYTKQVFANNINLIACDTISSPMKVTAKVRYSQKEETAILSQISENEILLEFDNPQRAVSPGQSVVIYDGPTVPPAMFTPWISVDCSRA